MEREALTIAVINGITSSEHYFNREGGIGRDEQGGYHVGCLDIGARKWRTKMAHENVLHCIFLYRLVQVTGTYSLCTDMKWNHSQLNSKNISHKINQPAMKRTRRAKSVT